MIIGDLNNSSLQTKIALHHVYGIAAGLGAVTITPLFYEGVIAGSEFLVYSADKLYFVLEFGASSHFQNAFGYVVFADEANAANKEYININAYWDVTGAVAKYNKNNYLDRNFYFSRIISNNDYTYLKFIGYRLDIAP